MKPRRRILITDFWFFLLLVTQTMAMLRAKVINSEMNQEIKLCLIGMVSFLLLFKARIEGFQINALLVFIFQFVFLIDIIAIPSLSSKESKPAERDATFYICFILFVFYGISVFALKSYHLPKPTGKYNVGYRDLETEGFSTAVFYPTTESIVRGKEKGGFNMEFFHQNMWTPIKTKTKLGKFIPSCLVYLAIDFLRKIKLHVRIDAEIAKISDYKYVPVIVTHGLTGDRICKSALCSELASQGFVVFAIEHVEEMLIPVDDAVQPEKSREFRGPQQDKRVEHITSLLDYLKKCNKKQEAFFSDVFVSFDLARAVFMGHSFGGGTLIQLLVEHQKELSKNPCVLIDPWLFHSKSFILKSTIVNPLLIMASEDWHEFRPYFEQKSLIQEIFNKKRDDKKGFENSIACTIKRSGHNSVNDLSFYIPQFAEKIKMVQNSEENFVVLEVIFSLIMNFLQSCGSSQGKGGGKPSQPGKEKALGALGDKYKGYVIQNFY